MIEKEFSSHDVEDLDEHSAGNSIFLAAAFFTFSAETNLLKLMATKRDPLKEMNFLFAEFSFEIIRKK